MEMTTIHINININIDIKKIVWSLKAAGEEEKVIVLLVVPSLCDISIYIEQLHKANFI
jgi:hypothetical protein